MDRRRFAPSTERLDERVLLTSTAQTLVSSTIPDILDKTARISRLDILLDSLAPNRVVPETLVTPLKADLTSIVGQLGNPGSPVLTAANLQYRSSLSHTNISSKDAAGLNATFGNALAAAGAPLSITNDFQNNMENLLKFDEQNPNPTTLAVNDYATVLELALAVGRPIHTPEAPRLLSTDAVGGKGSHVTYLTQPSVVGSYDAGTYVTLLDQNGRDLGLEQVPSTGNYEIQVNQPLTPGTYYLRVQAYDANGDHTLPSPAYRLVVRTKPVKATKAEASATPAGPLSL